MKKGKIITLSGISGTGKSYLKSYLVENMENVQSIITLTTREKRANEDKEPYKEFMTLDQFKQEYSAGNLCVVNKVFENWYAYRKSQIQSCDEGINLITELFYRNVQDVKDEFDNVLSVYVLPQDIKKAEESVLARKTNRSDLHRRLKEMKEEIEFFHQNRHLFDIVIQNDYTDKSCELLKRLIEGKFQTNPSGRVNKEYQCQKEQDD